jgi:hypothetical protein
MATGQGKNERELFIALFGPVAGRSLVSGSSLPVVGFCEAATICRRLVLDEIREGGLERDISGEGLIGGAHERLCDVVAYTGQIAKAY